MNYTDIHTFLTIASSPSLSKAAESLFVSQPALSHRMLYAGRRARNRTDHTQKRFPYTGALPKPDSVLSRLRANGSSYGLRQEKSNLNSLRHNFGL